MHFLFGSNAENFEKTATNKFFHCCIPSQTRLIFRKRLFTAAPPANKKLFTGAPPANKDLTWEVEGSMQVIQEPNCQIQTIINSRTYWRRKTHSIDILINSYLVIFTLNKNQTPFSSAFWFLDFNIKQALLLLGKLRWDPCKNNLVPNKFWVQKMCQDKNNLVPKKCVSKKILFQEIFLPKKIWCPKKLWV